MLQKKGFLLVGLAAAYAAYRFSKMSPDEKSSIKEKGRKLVGDYLPENLKSVLGMSNEPQTATAQDNSYKSGI